jgi:hypothetical protein
MNTVQYLRNNGFKVRILHHRLHNGHYRSNHQGLLFNDMISDPDSKGGFTKVIIDSPNGEHFVGSAVCNKTDNYNKKLGVRIAIGRSGVLNSDSVRLSQSINS